MVRFSSLLCKFPAHTHKNKIKNQTNSYVLHESWIEDIVIVEDYCKFLQS